MKQDFIAYMFCSFVYSSSIGSISNAVGPKYGNFPAIKVEADPVFNLPFFIFNAAVTSGRVILLVFPGLFGFYNPIM